jgi:hypothetical protein
MYIYYGGTTASSLSSVSTTSGVPASITSNNVTMLLGGRGGGGVDNNCWTGYLDHIRIYNTPLSQNQLETLRWLPAGFNEFTGCISAWRLDSTSTVIDYLQGSNGTPTVDAVVDGPPVRGA